MSEDLFEIVDLPAMREPTLVLALEGFGDAGLAVATSVAHLLATIETTVVAQFDTEILLDYRARRPTLHLVDGVIKDITWPAIELRHGRDLAGNDLLVLSGAEPDTRWQEFAETFADLVARLGVKVGVGLGSFPAGVPHTRKGRLATSAATPELANRVGERHSTLDVGAGAQSVVELACATAGVPTTGIWAQVPHYAAGGPFPGAAVNLLEAVADLGGLTLDLDGLREAATDVRSRLDEIVAEEPEQRLMVQQLEQHYDANVSSVPGREASAEDLVDELEDWLRNMESDTDT
jgi:hypothetical protein